MGDMVHTEPTPAPWRVGLTPDGNDSGFYDYTSPDGSIFAIVEGERVDVAHDVWNPADAHLMEAAPELFTALHLFLATHNPHNERNGRIVIACECLCCEEAAKAIRKARGDAEGVA